MRGVGCECERIGGCRPSLAGVTPPPDRLTRPRFRLLRVLVLLGRGDGANGPIFLTLPFSLSSGLAFALASSPGERAAPVVIKQLVLRRGRYVAAEDCYCVSP